MVFDVTPSHDPPFISWTAPVHVEATESGEVLYLGLEEGDAFVLKLEADDSQDGVLEEKTYFDWVLFDFYDPRYLVTEVFSLSPGLSGPDKLSEKRLFFKETPDFGSPPPGGEGNPPYTFKIGVTNTSGAVYEENPQEFRILDVSVSILNVPNESPVFVDLGENNFVIPYTEETNTSVVTLQAYDPDFTELEDGEAPRRIVYSLDGNTHGRNFNSDDFYLFPNYDLAGNEVSATMYFKNELPDFENPLQRSYSVEVRATEFDSLDFPREFTDQVVIVQVVNVNEAPSFLDAQIPDLDANFSLLEETEGQFTVYATTEDAVDGVEGLLLEISGEGPDDHLFKKISSSTSVNSLVFSFKEKPNFEKPLDANLYNYYEVEIMIKTASGKSLLSDRFKIRINDSEEKPKFVNSSLTNLLVNENEKLAIQLQVEDEESDEAFLDLLYATEIGVSFASNSWVETSPYGSLFDSEKSKGSGS